jgi:hypothetical protein
MMDYERLAKRLQATNERIAMTKELIALASTTGVQVRATMVDWLVLGCTRTTSSTPGVDNEDPQAAAFTSRIVAALKDYDAYLKDERLKIVFDLTNVAKLEMGG